MSLRKLFTIEVSNTLIGALTIIGNHDALYQLHFGVINQLTIPQMNFELEDGTNIPLLKDANAQLVEYFSGKRHHFSLSLEISTLSQFQQKVLNLCRQIPYGSVLSYGELALQADCPGAARAVGAAMAGNPIPVIIPCHRVIGSDRLLHGYAAPEGIASKAKLLQLEGHRIVAEKLD